MCNSRVVGLIVAAGYSSRMGAFKPLLPVGEKTVIETAVDSLRLSGIKDIRVIVGYRSAELYPLLERLQVDVIENRNYAAGMFSSVITGLKTFSGEEEAFFLLPGDTPLIRKRSIKDLIRVFRQTGAAVIYPVFNGQRGHPPLISAKLYDSILTGDGAGGLRHILDRFTADSVEVAVADQGVLLDIDTQEDYRQLIQFYERRKVPTSEECLGMLHKYQTSERVQRHGLEVAKVGRRLAELLSGAGFSICTELVVAGGLVHDLAKGKPNHPERGARMVRSMGFSSLAGIVASHMDLEFAAERDIDEAALVFLADKLVQGEQRVSLSERFKPALERFAGSPEILASILRRQQTAEIIQGRVAGLLGVNSVDELYEIQ
ncbi:DVU_1551 family NTP transferase [Sporomusa aerivorans]|uniref:DVU_1551 family NTP transferase n=1 Tax=Sporomusa aerivorans TaxID=204936 RepID=UPI00352A4D81